MSTQPAYKGALFKVRVGVILPHNGKLLLARQNNRPFWVTPGGTLEAGESLADCAIRELQEEANLAITVEKLLYVADFMRPEGQVIDVFFLGCYVSGELVMETTENLNEIGFYSPEEITNMAIQPKILSERLLTDWQSGFEMVNGLYLGAYYP